jgi:hypothetical protein
MKPSMFTAEERTFEVLRHMVGERFRFGSHGGPDERWWRSLAAKLQDHFDRHAHQDMRAFDVRFVHRIERENHLLEDHITIEPRLDPWMKAMAPDRILVLRFDLPSKTIIVSAHTRRG